MRRILILLLVVSLLVFPATAEEQTEAAPLEELMANFMAENGLHEGNFSLSYYNTVTGESYTFNDTAFMVAASTFKLPLNMYYYEMERDGLIEPDAFIPEAGQTLDKAHELSLVLSNNEVSIGMLYHLGVFSEYKECMRKYFTMTDEEIHYTYFVDNYYCTRMMMDALKYLYDHSADFEEMLGYMKQAQPGEYFRAGVTEYEVAHKYGWYDGAVNDVGIIYTEEPFLLAVYSYNAPYEGVVAEAARVLTDYNVDHYTPVPESEPEPLPEEDPELPGMENAVELEVQMVPLQEPEPEMIPEPEPEPTPGPEIEPEAEPLPEEEPEDVFVWWMVPVALGVFLLGGGGMLLIFNNKRLKKIYPETEEEETDR